MLNLTKVKTYPLAQRKSKVTLKDCAHVGLSSDFLDSLPNILAGKDFKQLVKDIVDAHARKKQVLVMIGAHVIKCGVSLYIIELLKKGVITHLAMNDACVVHDFELAFIGHTSESVEEQISHGAWGMAEETCTWINTAINTSAQQKTSEGLGYAVGKMIAEKNLPHKEASLLYWCYTLKVPATVHVAIGANIIHQHPLFDGAATGKLSHTDFKKLVETVSKLEHGVAINCGSAVLLPEVFGKSLNLVRNVGIKVHHIITANFDMLDQYRPRMNIVQRPTQNGGRGYNFKGHHELMIPLLTRCVLERIKS